jgi:hypothetical protein
VKCIKHTCSLRLIDYFVYALLFIYDWVHRVLDYIDGMSFLFPFFSEVNLMIDVC